MAGLSGMVLKAGCSGWRWPNTANPHLLISTESALRLGPVSYPWLNSVLRGLPASLERLRVDRQLEEALTTGADPLHLTAVFGISQTTALRYAQAARQLLQPEPEPGTIAESIPTRIRNPNNKTVPRTHFAAAANRPAP